MMTFKKSGFSLIELITVLVLVGILAAAVFRPSITATAQKARVTAVIRQIESDLALLRLRSIQTGKSQKCEFLSPTEYQTYRQHDSQNVWVAASKNMVLPEGVNLALDSCDLEEDVLIYGPGGYPFEGSGASAPENCLNQALTTTRSIVVLSSNGVQNILFVVPETGTTVYEDF